ncbi:hypothetical protein Ancab_016007 [Ancistrocladus abbreviatus]
MGCVSSTLLNRDDEFTQLSNAAGLSHHIVSLTSTTYGLLNLDSQSHSSSSATTPTPPRSQFSSEPLAILLRSEPEVINSWELMAGLDNDSFRFSPLPSSLSNSSKPSTPKIFSPRIIPSKNKENFNPNHPLRPGIVPSPSLLRPLSLIDSRQQQHSLDRFQKLCPPGGEDRLVLYTTTLKGVRKTFEDCNAVRSAIEGLGVVICERDISMDRGFMAELKELMRGQKESSQVVPPRVFVKGRYLGGADEVLRIHEEGRLGELLEGLPKVKFGQVCDGCGGARFLPCFQCNGSCKMVKDDDRGEKGGGEAMGWRRRRRIIVVKCSDCNENGLVLCPICS